MSEWRPIPGYEGYEVSSDGQVRSLTRMDSRGHTVYGRLRATYMDADGYRQVSLRANGRSFTRRVHRLVLLAFVGPCPEGQEVLHRDGSRSNNTLPNLSYGTRQENVLDSLRHGTNVNAAKTHCHLGHAFTEANTYRRGTARHCRKCTDIRRARYQAKKAMA